MVGSDAEFAQRAIASALRRHNPDSAVREARNEYLERQSDWSGDCQRCGAKLRGTLAQIRAHVCPEAEEAL